MKEYTIITDPTCDLTQDILDKYNIKIASGKESDVRTLFENEINSGHDILYLGIGQTISCSFTKVCILAMNLREAHPEVQIISVDTRSASLGQGLLVYLTALEKEKGVALCEAAAFAENNKLNMCQSFMVDNHYPTVCKRTGRFRAFLRSILHFRPILRVNDEGMMDTVVTVQGTKRALRKLIDGIRKNITDVTAPVFVGYARCEDKAKRFAEMLRLELGLKDVRVTNIKSLYNCDGKPGILGAFYFGASRHPNATR